MFTGSQSVFVSRLLVALLAQSRTHNVSRQRLALFAGWLCLAKGGLSSLSSSGLPPVKLLMPGVEERGADPVAGSLQQMDLLLTKWAIVGFLTFCWRSGRTAKSCRSCWGCYSKGRRGTRIGEDWVADKPTRTVVHAARCSSGCSLGWMC
jgi:hypothetical protein